MDSITITLPYGGQSVEFTLAGAELIGQCGIAERPPVQDLGQAVRSALAAPVASDALSKMARGKARVVIISDDATRPTPVASIVPCVMDEINAAGVTDDAVTVVMANGTHRSMTQAEIEQKIGPEMASRLRVENHDYRADDLVDLGATPSGVPVAINRRVAEADLVIGIGSIVPHRYCGWSGGAKIVQPGVCGEKTTVATHLMITRDPGVRIGNVENVVRHEMEAVAKRAGLRFIVNVVLNARGEVTHVVAGDPMRAHREGVVRAMEVAAACIPCRADLVIAGSHPADMNFWQAGKALYTADLAVVDGGTIILVTPAYEGIGEHPEFGALLGVEYDEIMSSLESGLIGDRLGAAAALAVRLVARRARIVVVTDGLRREEVEKMGFEYYPRLELQRAVDNVVARYRGGAGCEACKTIVLTEAPDVLPVIQSELDQNGIAAESELDRS